MSTPFKMKGFSGFGNSPMKQDKGLQQSLVEKRKKATKKYRLMSSKRNDGTTEYFKVSGGSSTDGGKTFTPTVKTKISEATYNSMKGQ